MSSISRGSSPPAPDRSLVAAVAAMAAIVSALLFGSATSQAGDHSAARSLDTQQVAPGAELTVTIAARGFGAHGRVSETLPEGWVYTGSSLPEAAISTIDRTVRFLLLDDLPAEGTFSYTVRAPYTAGAFAFSGIIADADRMDAVVGGASEVAVRYECLRGPVVAGSSSLALAAGGAVDDLAGCAAARGVSAFYTLHDGEWAPYFLGAPDFVNQSFYALFAEGLPADTPLIVRGTQDLPGAEAAAGDAALAALMLEGVAFGGFSPDRTEYAGHAEDGVGQATVRATAAQPEASVGILPADADGDSANGHQAALEPGMPVSVTVTSADGAHSQVYRVWIVGDAPEDIDTPPEDDPPLEIGEQGAPCLRGKIGTGFSLVVYAGGAVERMAACARAGGAVVIYALADGGYVAYVLGAAALDNRTFSDLFPHGLPPDTPLVVGSQGESGD